MSNTDIGGSTEGTQAYDAGRAVGGGGAAASARAPALEADESAAAESRLKPNRRGTASEPRKSRYRWVAGRGCRRGCRSAGAGSRPCGSGEPSESGEPCERYSRALTRALPPSHRRRCCRLHPLCTGACSGTAMARSGAHASTPTRRGTLVGGVAGWRLPTACAADLPGQPDPACLQQPCAALHPRGSGTARLNLRAPAPAHLPLPLQATLSRRRRRARRGIWRRSSTLERR
jgi:hypothetical protein